VSVEPLFRVPLGIGHSFTSECESNCLFFSQRGLGKLHREYRLEVGDIRCTSLS
jgi:hypothetical protein